MSAPAFTPGPWEAFHRPQGVGITGGVAADFVIPSSIVPEEREAVADYAVARCLTSLNGFDPIAERQANAHLIAAAPELYEALDELHLKAVVGTDDERHAALDKAWRALTKARGEA